MLRIIFSVLLILCANITFGQVVVTPFGSGANLCPGNTAGYTALTDSIIIYETSANTDMGFGVSPRYFELSAPNGFSFNPGIGSYGTSAGSAFSGQALTVTANTIRFDYTLGAGSAITQDSVYIYGIEVLADTGAVSGNIVMTSDNAVINGNETSDVINHGTLTTSQTATISSSSNVTCFGDATGTATISLSGGTIDGYLWNDVSTQTTATASALIAGTYVGLINFNTFCWASDTIDILEPAGPVLSVSIPSFSHVTVNGGSDGWANSSGIGGPVLFHIYGVVLQSAIHPLWQQQQA